MTHYGSPEDSGCSGMDEVGSWRKRGIFGAKCSTGGWAEDAQKEREERSKEAMEERK